VKIKGDSGGLTDVKPNPIRAARLKLGMSQDELASRAGITRVSVSYAETGRVKPTAGTLRKLAAVLEVPATELGLEPDPAERDQWIIKGVLQEVEDGEMTAHDAIDVLRREGILQPRRGAVRQINHAFEKMEA
jgi:transcriptional regulator with XRE-family HTH domain